MDLIRLKEAVDELRKVSFLTGDGGLAFSKAQAGIIDAACSLVDNTTSNKDGKWVQWVENVNPHFAQLKDAIIHMRGQLEIMQEKSQSVYRNVYMSERCNKTADAATKAIVELEDAINENLTANLKLTKQYDIRSKDASYKSKDKNMPELLVIAIGHSNNDPSFQVVGDTYEECAERYELFHDRAEGHNTPREGHVVILECKDGKIRLYLVKSISDGMTATFTAIDASKMFVAAKCFSKDDPYAFMYGHKYSDCAEAYERWHGRQRYHRTPSPGHYVVLDCMDGKTRKFMVNHDKDESGQTFYEAMEIPDIKIESTPIIPVRRRVKDKDLPKFKEMMDEAEKTVFVGKAMLSPDTPLAESHDSYIDNLQAQLSSCQYCGKKPILHQPCKQSNSWEVACKEVNCGSQPKTAWCNLPKEAVNEWEQGKVRRYVNVEQMLMHKASIEDACNSLKEKYGKCFCDCPWPNTHKVDVYVNSYGTGLIMDIWYDGQWYDYMMKKFIDEWNGYPVIRKYKGRIKKTPETPNIKLEPPVNVPYNIKSGSHAPPSRLKENENEGTLSSVKSKPQSEMFTVGEKEALDNLESEKSTSTSISQSNEYEALVREVTGVETHKSGESLEKVLYAACALIRKVDSSQLTFDSPSISNHLCTPEFKTLKDAICEWRSSGEGCYKVAKAALAFADKSNNLPSDPWRDPIKDPPDTDRFVLVWEDGHPAIAWHKPGTDRWGYGNVCGITHWCDIQQPTSEFQRNKSTPPPLPSAQPINLIREGDDKVRHPRKEE
jgi:hypothetical protein